VFAWVMSLKVKKPCFALSARMYIDSTITTQQHTEHATLVLCCVVIAESVYSCGARSGIGVQYGLFVFTE